MVIAAFARLWLPIFRYVGFHYLNAALVSRGWRALYATVHRAFRSRLPLLPCCTLRGHPQNLHLVTSIKHMASSVPLLAWAFDNGCPRNSVILWSAAARGDLAVLKFAHESDVPWGMDYPWGAAWRATETCSAAAQHGRVEALLWLRDNGAPWPATTLCQAALRGGQLDLLHWACAHDCPWGTRDISSAVQPSVNGFRGPVDRILACVEWVLADGCPCDEETMPYCQHLRERVAREAAAAAEGGSAGRAGSGA
ncbi:hypothetical protein JKP88DRAFT_349867 [Tribonema minus]|uniref:Uncharacterized protein n=1 Tax=Tribonema minus TaxID=303371 RepID=A0A835YYW1_9STRA|nr:hypothetical protein JKP88DRAFT_349867 [Tribonema minus]